MLLNMNEYCGMMQKLNIDIVYSGPMWKDGIKGIAGMVKSQLARDDISGNAAKSIFSVFIEQVTNMLMYSAEKDQHTYESGESKGMSPGLLVLGRREDKTYFFQTRNIIMSSSAESIKDRIDLLNSLDKKSLRQYHRERLNAENENPDSKGAGLGLIEIARRATVPLKYDFEPLDGGLSYFTLYVEIGPNIKED